MSEYTLVTGGAGYIGSHTVLELLDDGRKVIVLDNMSNSCEEVINRLECISGKKITFTRGDVQNEALLVRLFTSYRISEVIHFAGLKSVNESISQPLAYYHNNFYGTMVLCKTMANFGVFNLVFSSSAAVYGSPIENPIKEEFDTGGVTNPYGRTKHMVEGFLHDLSKSDRKWKIAILRYFNPVGAHESGLIGEDPGSVPNNLLPYIARVAVGRLPKLQVFGGDYPTSDGTGVRDFIHVVDLAVGHMNALHYINDNDGLAVWNLGTGRGHSVIEVIKVFEEVSGRKIPYEIVDRRVGDIAACWADATKAKKELGWAAKKNLYQMVEDAWRWQRKNPDGFAL